MAGEQPSAFAELRKKIADAISRTLHQFVTSDRGSVEEALLLLASDRTIHPESTRVITEFYGGSPAQREAFFAILASLDPRKIEYILNQIYAAMDTPEWLIGIKADLDALVAERGAKTPAPLRELGSIFTDYFAKVFNFQYLLTRCCDAQNTSLALLKFISEKEGVHPAEHWWNFENRLNSPDHIIISLEHFKMPYVPLVYVEVALAKGIIRKMTKILADTRRVVDLTAADTAIFYSLNTTMPGLEGIALGAKMIIRAREYIERTYPQIRYFVTLSPMPGFRAYLTKILAGGAHDFSLTIRKIDANKHGRFFSNAELREIRRAAGAADAMPIAGLLKQVLADERWYAQPAMRRAMRRPMTALARYYLTREKRINSKTRERSTHAYDQVANFHLSNGAGIGSINYLANRSARGMRESFGVMVNYLYDGKQIEKNKRLYRAGEVVCKV